MRYWESFRNISPKKETSKTSPDFLTIQMKKSLLFVPLFLFLILPIYGRNELVGPLSKEDILENFPDWQGEVASYLPKAEIISRLNSIDYEIKIEVFLGIWCPDSKQHVSAYIKIMEMAENPFIRTLYIGIPKEKDARQPYIQGKDIVKVPTFIVYINDEERGRIIEHPKKSVEEDLVDIIEIKKS